MFSVVLFTTLKPSESIFAVVFVELELTDIYAGMDSGEIKLRNVSTGEEYILNCSFTERQKAILKAGSLLAYTKEIGE